MEYKNTQHAIRNKYLIAPMQLSDVVEIMKIERAVFSAAWPAEVYRYELRRNKLAHYFVARARATAALRDAENRGGLTKYLPRWARRWLDLRGFTLSGKPRRSNPILGYAGAWVFGDKAHISTIAVHPAHRLRGVARALLSHLIEHAVQTKCRAVTLEVRASNSSAQKLYLKYGFEVVGRYKRYYSDSGEDAVIMTLALNGTRTNAD